MFYSRWRGNKIFISRMEYMYFITALRIPCSKISARVAGWYFEIKHERSECIIYFNTERSEVLKYEQEWVARW